MGVNFLEKEMLNNFIKNLEDDMSLPKNLVNSIKKLHLADKLAMGDTLKKKLEEFLPPEALTNEDKPY